MPYLIDGSSSALYLNSSRTTWVPFTSPKLHTTRPAPAKLAAMLYHRTIIFDPAARRSRDQPSRWPPTTGIRPNGDTGSLRVTN
jgi:hypothetical protein